MIPATIPRWSRFATFISVLISASSFLLLRNYFTLPLRAECGLQDLMEDYFQFYDQEKDNLHPVVLAAEMHERLVTIHPFIDGNGRTSRLIMNSCYAEV